jgi:hypothetical protein
MSREIPEECGFDSQDRFVELIAIRDTPLEIVEEWKINLHFAWKKMNEHMLPQQVGNQEEYDEYIKEGCRIQDEICKWNHLLTKYDVATSPNLAFGRKIPFTTNGYNISISKECIKIEKKIEDITYIAILRCETDIINIDIEIDNKVYLNYAIENSDKLTFKAVYDTFITNISGSG